LQKDHGSTRLQAEEGDPDLKVLVFTEFVLTQEMLMRFLSERGFEVVCAGGSLGLEERKRVQDTFAKDVRILISTEAGGEGLNLRFCQVVINYDIPWNRLDSGGGDRLVGRGLLARSSQRFGRSGNSLQFHEPVSVPPEAHFHGSSGCGLWAARCAATWP